MLSKTGKLLMTKKIIYIVICEDRYIETPVYPFSDKEMAISEARRIAKEYCRFEGYYEEEDVEGCLFYARYSWKDDCIRVVEATINKTI
jgi:hypothetical protein